MLRCAAVRGPRAESQARASCVLGSATETPGALAGAQHDLGDGFHRRSLYDGRRFRTFNVIVKRNREGPAIEVGSTLPALRVIAVLEELIGLHGMPRSIRLDNGPELTSLALTVWY